jgi:WD40 repeat protein
MFAGIGLNDSVLVCDLETGALAATLTGHHATVSGIVFKPDEAILMTSDGGGSLRLWNTRDWKLVQELHGVVIHGMNISPDGSRLVAGGGDGFVRLWDLRTRQELGLLNSGATIIQNLAFAPDLSSMLVVGSKGQLAIWRADDPR